MLYEILFRGLLKTTVVSIKLTELRFIDPESGLLSKSRGVNDA